MTPSISVVMPLYQGAGYLGAVLAPLMDAVGRGELTELIVVDDGSTDEGPERCHEAGARVVEGGTRSGPAAARNLGAQSAQGEILLFVDADVVIHRDVPFIVGRFFEQNPGWAALFGSYDDRPAAPGWVSRYRNLLHHYVHQTAPPEADTFWAGCGAIRREVFASLGGFDAERFGQASIEDIELGVRLRNRGERIRLDRDLKSTHLKRWTLGGMIATDIKKRALPWSRLLLEPGGRVQALNLAPAERVRAALACAAWAALPLALWKVELAFVPVALFAVSWLASAPFYALVWRSAGPGPWLAALVLHQLYYLYSSAVYAYCWVEQFWRARPHTAEAGS